MVAERVYVWQNRLFDKTSKEIVKIKTETPNNHQTKGQTLLDCLPHFDTRSGPTIKLS